jgi:hypothetical protein
MRNGTVHDCAIRQNQVAQQISNVVREADKFGDTGSRREIDLLPFDEFSLRKAIRVATDNRLHRGQGRISNQHHHSPVRCAAHQRNRSTPSTNSFLTRAQIKSVEHDAGIENQCGRVATLGPGLSTWCAHHQGWPVINVGQHALATG